MSSKKLFPLYVVCLSCLVVHLLTGSGKPTAVLCLIIGALTVAASIPAIIKSCKELKKHG